LLGAAWLLEREEHRTIDGEDAPVGVHFRLVLFQQMLVPYLQPIQRGGTEFMVRFESETDARSVPSVCGRNLQW
jgi:hypothetical protein